MAQIIESIPNISEGRRPEVIEACVDQKMCIRDRSTTIRPA